MNIKKTNYLIKSILFIVLTCISILIYFPIANLFIINSQSHEPLIEFIYAVFVDLIILTISCVIFNHYLNKLLGKEMFELLINDKSFIFENIFQKIKYEIPETIYRYCIKNRKITEKYIGFKIGKETILAMFDNYSDLKEFDELYRLKYSENTVEVKGKIIKIKKLTNGSS